jgi:hypothetical protein
MRAMRRLAMVVIAGVLFGSFAARAAEPLPDAARGAAAAGAPSALSAARFEGAERARSEGRFEEALAGYREATAIDPSARFAVAARARASELEAHAEGGFAPFAKLEAVRRDPAKREDRASIEALERELGGFPEGRVRSEAALLVGEAFWHRFGEPRRAIAPLTFALEDAAADRLTRSLALRGLATVWRDLGEIGQARDLLERYPDLAPETLAEVLRLDRRGKLLAISLAVLAVIAAIGAGSLVHAARRLGGVREVQRAVVRPLSVAFSLYLGGAAAILVHLRGEGDPRPFLWLGLGVLVMDVIARTWRLASDDRRAVLRAVRVVTCVAGVLAFSFLSIELTHEGDLSSFGP